MAQGIILCYVLMGPTDHPVKPLLGLRDPVTHHVSSAKVNHKLTAHSSFWPVKVLERG